MSVAVVENGVDMDAIMAERPFDLVLLDLHLPGEGGISIAGACAANGKSRSSWSRPQSDDADLTRSSASNWAPTTMSQTGSTRATAGAIRAVLRRTSEAGALRRTPPSGSIASPAGR